MAEISYNDTDWLIKELEQQPTVGTKISWLVMRMGFETLEACGALSDAQQEEHAAQMAELCVHLERIIDTVICEQAN